MTIKEAIKQRHMVRKYTDKKIPAELTDSLNARIEEHNKKYGLNLNWLSAMLTALQELQNFYWQRV